MYHRFIIFLSIFGKYPCTWSSTVWYIFSGIFSNLMKKNISKDVSIKRYIQKRHLIKSGFKWNQWVFHYSGWNTLKLETLEIKDKCSCWNTLKISIRHNTLANNTFAAYFNAFSPILIVCILNKSGVANLFFCPWVFILCWYYSTYLYGCGWIWLVIYSTLRCKRNWNSLPKSEYPLNCVGLWSCIKVTPFQFKKIHNSMNLGRNSQVAMVDDLRVLLYVQYSQWKQYLFLIALILCWRYWNVIMKKDDTNHFFIQLYVAKKDNFILEALLSSEDNSLRVALLFFRVFRTVLENCAQR